MNTEIKVAYEKHETKAPVTSPGERARYAELGLCPDHPHIQLRKRGLFGRWITVHKQCPLPHNSVHSRDAVSGQDQRTQNQASLVVPEIELLRNAATDEKNVYHALSGIATGARDWNYSEKIHATGGVRQIANAMSIHRRKPKVIEKAFEVLKALNENEGCVADMVDADCVTLITAYMMANSDNAELQAQGCNTLWAFLLESKLRREFEEVLYGGIMCILEAMRHHPNDCEVHEYGCMALFAMAQKIPSSLETLHEEGGYQMVLEASQKFPNSQFVLKACEELEQLLQDYEN